MMDGVNEETAKACIDAFEGIGCVLKVSVNGEELNTESTDNVVEGQLMFSVYLEDVGAEKVKVIQVIRDELGYELQEAKELVEAAPVIIYVASDLVSASEICDKLAEVGSTATIEAFENPVVGENPKAESNEEVNTEEDEENDDAENETTEEVPEVNTEESDDDDYFTMGKFGYFNFPGYQVYIESVGDNGIEVENAYRDFFGDSGTPIKSYEIMSAKDLVVWEIYSETMANDLNKALQDAGAISYVKQCDDLYIIPDEIISGDEDEIAAFVPRDYRMDLMQRNMFMGQMVYGNIAVGDTVYALLEDGTEVELVIRRTYRLRDRVQSIDAGDWSALMFESDIPNDKACQTYKIIKRAE
ncbi:MAG: ribosomal protein L7/L12 [Lachnospiraceae bacterium]|nr:ribosomal protein L7/L12 [Lachnospiraceae bacterium]